MSLAFPYADEFLAAGDGIIGFDWLGYVLWIDRFPWLIEVMDLSYSGLSGYAMVIFLLLLLGRQATERRHEMLALSLRVALSPLFVIKSAPGEVTVRGRHHAL
jgi:hypothetical protein